MPARGITGICVESALSSPLKLLCYTLTIIVYSIVIFFSKKFLNFSQNLRLDNCLTETKVGLDAERMEVGQRINCNRGDPNPIHDHSRLSVDCWGQRPGQRLNDWYSPGCWVAPWSNGCQRRGQDRHEHQCYGDVVYYEEIKRELSLKKTQVTVL